MPAGRKEKFRINLDPIDKSATVIRKDSKYGKAYNESDKSIGGSRGKEMKPKRQADISKDVSAFAAAAKAVGKARSEKERNSKGAKFFKHTERKY